MSKKLQSTLLAVSMLASVSAFAGSDTRDFQVTATVTDTCAVNSADDLSFGNYVSNQGSAVTGSTTVNLTCSNGAAFTLSLSGGSHAGESNRNMNDGSGHNLAYDLYTDSGYSSRWYDGAGGTSNQSGTGTGSSTSFTVYGQVPGSQSVVAGSYNDTVTATLNFS